MTGLLEGVRVIDLSRILAGPYAAQALGELGADVIKIEPPSGDPARRIGPFVDGRSLYFSSLNTNKRSVVVDLHDDDGRRAIDAVLGSGDIVIENFRPTTAARLGLTAPNLLAAHPHLVVVSMPGYAGSSSRADEPAYDLTVQAESGIMAVTGEPGRPPVRAGVPVGDLAAGLWAAIAGVSGYVARLRTGAGTHIEVPLLDATLSMLSYVATSAAGLGEEPVPVGSGHHTVVPYGAFPTRDGWLAIAVLGDKFWAALVSALNLEGLAEFTDNETRRRRREDVEAAITAALADLSRDEAMALLREAGVPHAPVLGVLDALDTSYVAETGRVETVAVGVHSYRYVRSPLSTTPVSRSAPDLGEHTEEVLQEISSEQVERLQAD